MVELGPAPSRKRDRPLITHLLPPDQLVADEVFLEGDGYRHLFRARRLAVGAELRVVDGRGRARRASVAGVEKRRARLVLGGDLPGNEPSVDLHLWVGALRSERASWLVEKVTELGAVSVVFFGSERTPRSYGDGRVSRLVRVASSALEQCHRARLPTIRGVVEWREVVEALPPTAVFLHPGGPPLEPARLPGGRVDLVIGPEGGLSKTEVAALEEVGAAPWGLGPTVLRVETAAVVGASLALFPQALRPQALRPQTSGNGA